MMLIGQPCETIFGTRSEDTGPTYWVALTLSPTYYTRLTTIASCSLQTVKFGMQDQCRNTLATIGLNTKFSTRQTDICMITFASP